MTGPFTWHWSLSGHWGHVRSLVTDRSVYLNGHCLFIGHWSLTGPVTGHRGPVWSLTGPGTGQSLDVDKRKIGICPFGKTRGILLGKTLTTRLWSYVDRHHSIWLPPYICLCQVTYDQPVHPAPVQVTGQRVLPETSPVIY
ncbi:hypothetical protein DPMN_037574 [Dreissena polymorpha]|uniref:Uncharacterized protein n=1 Tax=Dreissena polymorpha TaxID=45954 RepID=A0A9D4MFB7_DREPO|nr:hypothetical protein DPMN_037574 [Dreissena polymorpha]